MTDIVQYGLVLPSLVHHVRLHLALDRFEEKIGYKFKNRYLLQVGSGSITIRNVQKLNLFSTFQLAMTHPSYKENAGTNPDHIRNSLSNCGIRQPTFGDRKEVAAASRKKGINRLFQ
jgi:ribonuclease-3